MIFDIQKMTDELMSEPIRKWKHRTFDGLGALLPERDDPTVLFKNNWLGQGQSFAIVGSSGIGKSSITDQMALNWAVGETFLATPLRELKIAIIQAEDSDRDLKEQREGMRRGFREIHGWTEDYISMAISKIDIPTDFIGLQGEKFINLLDDYQHDCKCDVLFVNPLQRYFGGDVSSQEDASAFCAAVDKIIKSPECPCAIGIDMHTPKFKSGQKDDRASVDDYGEYLMAGSHEWTDWCRAVFAFLKHNGSETYFDFRATKRGKRLGWTDSDGNPTTKKVFKHTDGFIFWQEVTDPEELAAMESKTDTGVRGRPKKRELQPKETAAIWATSYGEHIDGHDVTEVFAYFRNDLGDSYSAESVRCVVDYLANNAEDFGYEIEVRKSRGRRGQQVIFHRHHGG